MDHHWKCLIAFVSAAAIGSAKEVSLFMPHTNDFKTALAGKGYVDIQVSSRGETKNCPFSTTFGRNFTARDSRGNSVPGEICRTFLAQYIVK